MCRIDCPRTRRATRIRPAFGRPSADRSHGAGTGLERVNLLVLFVVGLLAGALPGNVRAACDDLRRPNRCRERQAPRRYAHRLRGAPARPVQPRSNGQLRGHRRPVRPAGRGHDRLERGRRRGRRWRQGRDRDPRRDCDHRERAGSTTCGGRPSPATISPSWARCSVASGGLLSSRVDRLATSPGIVALGAVHGLMPCPIIYPAYLYAFSLGSPTRGALAGRPRTQDDPHAVRLRHRHDHDRRGDARAAPPRAGAAFIVLGYIPSRTG